MGYYYDTRFVGHDIEDAEYALSDDMKAQIIRDYVDKSFDFMAFVDFVIEYDSELRDYLVEDAMVNLEFLERSADETGYSPDYGGLHFVIDDRLGNPQSRRR